MKLQTKEIIDLTKANVISWESVISGREYKVVINGSDEIHLFINEYSTGNYADLVYVGQKDSFERQLTEKEFKDLYALIESKI